MAGPFAATAAELGSGGGRDPRVRAPGERLGREIREGLAQRREQDLRMGRSSWGPHLDELKTATAGRSLRRYGSQGQQRAALLALLFAERDALLEARRVAPLLLLDDVMSELDPGRRERLVERLQGGGQALITAADEESLPARRDGQRPTDALARSAAGGGRVTRRRAPRPAASRAPRRPSNGPRHRRGWRRSRRPGPRRSAAARGRAEPASERGGTVTIECADPVWAQELDLMQGQLLERLRAQLGELAPRACASV